MALSFAKGYNTIEKKLDQECTGYARMDNLFGNKQNVKPHSTMQSGLNLFLQATGFDSDSEEEEQGDNEEGIEAVMVMDNEITPEAVSTSYSLANNLNAAVFISTKKARQRERLPDSMKALCATLIKEHSEDLPNKLFEGKK